MFSSEILTDLQRLAKSDSAHVALPRELFIDLVRQSKTDDAGAVKAAELFSRAPDVQELTTTTRLLADMVERLSPATASPAPTTESAT